MVWDSKMSGNSWDRGTKPLRNPRPQASFPNATWGDGWTAFELSVAHTIGEKGICASSTPQHRSWVIPLHNQVNYLYILGRETMGTSQAEMKTNSLALSWWLALWIIYVHQRHPWWRSVTSYGLPSICRIKWDRASTWAVWPNHSVKQRNRRCYTRMMWGNDWESR